MITRLRNLFKDEEGATMVEYALLVALIAIALIAVISVLRLGIGRTFQGAADSMPAP